MLLCRLPEGVRLGFVPFMGFPSSAVRFSGESLKFTSRAANGNEAVRNSCPVCGGLVFGGEVGKVKMFTIYAGSLDDPSLFHPTVAVFTHDHPTWAVIPSDLTVHERGY